MREDTLRKVKRYMQDSGMLKDCSAVILGVSGGPDSMTMLHILNRLKGDFGYSLYAVHVNHEIRGEEALRDQCTVEKVCADWEIPCSVYTYDVPALASQWKLGTEETGRKVRREAFQEEKSKISSEGRKVRIALAHNQNDMAETMLHHLARGTGIRGMCSLKPVNGEIIRPLLCLERDEIVRYATEHKIPTVQDSSNQEDEYTRNRIRRHILPLLTSEVNPKAIAHMAEASEIFEQAESYFTAQARNLADVYTTEGGRRILTADFFAREEIIQRYVIRELLEQTAGHQSDLTSGHILKIRALYDLQTGRRINLPYNVEVVRVYEGVEIRKKVPALNQAHKTQESKCLNIPGETDWTEGCFFAKVFSYNGEKISEKTYTKWFDCDKINSELCVRTRRIGDYMTVNKNGGRKKVTRCMIDDKIPGDLREKLPLIADGDEILWIVGGRMNERYKITSKTGRVLEITYQGGTNNE